MTPERWARIREVFGTALETAEQDRPAFLDSACNGDNDLRAQVERLLSANETGTLESPVAHLLAAGAELSPGDTLGHYQIESKLGAGGMGVVYKALDLNLHRDVALKVLPPEHLSDPERKQQLIREARSASALNHPGIVTVYEIGSHLGIDFISMEYIEGQSLARAIPDNGLPAHSILEYGIEIADALAKAHAAGVIHRDLKPANIMITGDGRIKLLDFGLAGRRPLEKTETAALTAAGEISGTIGYMSPEQLRGLPLDARTDLFSFGVVLYEMAAHARPFTGNSAGAVCQAILNNPPREFEGVSVPGRLKSVIGKLLQKNPADRYASAAEVEEELKDLRRPLAPARLANKARIAIAAAAIAVIALGGWFWRQNSRERWAQQSAIPAIQRLMDSGEYVEAADLAERARAIVQGNAVLEKFWLLSTGEVSIASTPPGADVSIRLYVDSKNRWKSIGKTPLHRVRVARGTYVFRLTRPQLAPYFFIASPPAPPAPGYHDAFSVKIKLREQTAVPDDMAPVAGGRLGLTYPMSHAPGAAIQDFLIDRHEVTNGDYKKFIDAGGYQKTEFWKQPFVKDGKSLSWEEAISVFRDSTGRPGPATWKLGLFPTGREKYPVAGVSWYEAAAYSEFVGKNLPTAYHWMQASQAQAYTDLIAANSNFGPALKPVGESLSGHDTRDMAGNVKEWCWNETGEGKRLILGGGFDEPEYNFNHVDVHSPWDRYENFGFRCARYDSGAPEAAAAARLDAKLRDYWHEKPGSDEILRAYRQEIQYDDSDLNARTERTEAVDNGTRLRISFDAAYGHERVPAYLFLPKQTRQPYQIVVYFPGAFSYFDDKIDLAALEETRAGFLLKSGRSFIIPIYKGTYERRDGFSPNSPVAVYRDHAVAWSRDLRRTIDYLQTRPDIDTSRMAYFGDSGGVPSGVRLLTIEKRIKVAVFSSGGLQQTMRYLPEADPFNFIRHLKIPVLMINGRYDGTFPQESSQRALFEFLGTPPADKKHVVYEGGHGAFPRPAAIREVLEWLDKYLGPVQPSGRSP